MKFHQQKSRDKLNLAIRFRTLLFDAGHGELKEIAI